MKKVKEALMAIVVSVLFCLVMDLVQDYYEEQRKIAEKYQYFTPSVSIGPILFKEIR